MTKIRWLHQPLLAELSCLPKWHHHRSGPRIDPDLAALALHRPPGLAEFDEVAAAGHSKGGG
jgi:hypothetical protein